MLSTYWEKYTMDSSFLGWLWRWFWWNLWSGCCDRCVTHDQWSCDDHDCPHCHQECGCSHHHHFRINWKTNQPCSMQIAMRKLMSPFYDNHWVTEKYYHSALIAFIDCINQEQQIDINSGFVKGRKLSRLCLNSFVFFIVNLHQSIMWSSMWKLYSSSAQVSG